MAKSQRSIGRLPIVERKSFPESLIRNSSHCEVASLRAGELFAPTAAEMGWSAIPDAPVPDGKDHRS
jgi:hypothetical protein